MKNIEIKFQDHFKLNVPFKDMIIFEAELHKNGIPFYTEENEAVISDGVRYFFLDSDSEKVNSIITENIIIADTDTINISDYRDERKFQGIYFVAAAVVILIVVAILFLMEK